MNGPGEMEFNADSPGPIAAAIAMAAGAIVFIGRLVWQMSGLAARVSGHHERITKLEQTGAAHEQTLSAIRESLGRIDERTALLVNRGGSV